MSQTGERVVQRFALGCGSMRYPVGVATRNDPAAGGSPIPSAAPALRVNPRGRGRVVRAVRVAVEDARAAGRLRPYDEPSVELAIGLAQALDAAFVVSDVHLIRQLTGDLRAALAGLPLRPVGAPGGGSDGGSGDRAGDAWQQLVGAEPH